MLEGKIAMEENNIEKGDGACLVGSTAIFSPVRGKASERKYLSEDLKYLGEKALWI